MSNKPYYYNSQFRKYLIQIMSIFAGLQVRVGKNETEDSRLISVPIFYGSRDRVVASLLADNTQNKPLRVPCMSAYLKDVSPAPDARHGIDVTRSNSYLPRSGLFPDDIKVVSQLMPIPYWLTVEVQLYASNTDQHFQLLEQILMLFNPSIQLQINDTTFDWTKIFTIELTGIRNEENFPSGTDRRILQTNLEFRTLVYISAPAEVKSNYINDIYLRIGLINEEISDSEEVIAALDGDGILYELLLSGEKAKN